MGTEIEMDISDLEVNLQNYILKVSNDLINLIKEEAPVSSGHLRQSWQMMAREEGSIYIGTPVKYASYVQFGTRPHTPPFTPIKKWARRKLGAEEAAGAIWQKIRQEGTDANPYITRAIRRLKKKYD